MITIAEFGLLRDDNAYTFSRMIIRAQRIQNSASYLWKKRFGSMPGGHLRPPFKFKKTPFFCVACFQKCEWKMSNVTPLVPNIYAKSI